MENKKEKWSVKQCWISKKKVAGVMIVVILGVGTYLYFSEEARALLRQGGAIAARSFEDLFAPSATGTIVSEIDRVMSSSRNESNETDGTSSDALIETSDGYVTSSQAEKKNGTIVPDGGKIEYKGDQAASTTSESNTPEKQAVMFVPLPVAESSSPTEDASDCSFPVSPPAVVSHAVILNEIAWMGLPTSTGETAEQAANREWIELKNISGTEVPLDGWWIVNANSGIKISFGSGDTIAPEGFYLLSRGGNPVNGVSADKAYTGTLSNSGDKLAVLDATCNVSDFLDASVKWPGGSHVTKQTLERTAALGWQTSAAPGGTPHSENSTGVPVPVIISSSTEKYGVDVTIAGNGGGILMIEPGNISCKTSCEEKYAVGTTVVIAATPENGALFTGWSGGCSGTSACSFVVGGPVSIIADFYFSADNLPTVDAASPVDASNTATPSSTAESPGGVLPPVVDHLVIAAIQIGGAASSDDFVKIYNPTLAATDIGGWKLRKKSSTGTDSSLREFPKGSEIAPGGYFTWASSADSFAGSIGADVSSTETLAANNSAALFDASGTQIDAVAWGTGTNQYVESAPYSQSPATGQVLQRKFVGGTVIDTDNNNNDFIL